MKTLELTGEALDWAVAKCENIGLGPRGFVVYYHEGEPAMWQPSTDWAQGGPIIEREKIGIDCDDQGVWFASYDLSVETAFGASSKSSLIAAMRCYVTSKMGDTVELPQELI